MSWLRLLEKGSWMTDYRQFKSSNADSISGFEGMYKGIFFMIHFVAIILLSLLSGAVVSIREFFLNDDISIIENLLFNSVYIFIIMFITMNGIMVLSEVILGIRKRIL